MNRAIIGMVAALPAWTAAQDPAASDGWVVLSLDDYRTLRAKAFPSPAAPTPPPVDATLSRVDYALRVTGDTVTPLREAAGRRRGNDRELPVTSESGPDAQTAEVNARPR